MLTISEMWKQLVEFDHTIHIVYYKELRKTAVEADGLIYAIEDHVDKAIYEAWHTYNRLHRGIIL